MSLSWCAESFLRPRTDGLSRIHPDSRIRWRNAALTRLARAYRREPVASEPVIALTGYLGAGKTTLLNHVLRVPGARIGVVINDFGELNVDAALVTGQVDEPASIAGGCICCLPDEGGLDEALAKLADPRLGLDAIIVEASGLADPVAISRIIRFSGVERVRHGGVVDVVDAATHFDTVDQGGICRHPLPRTRADLRRQRRRNFSSHRDCTADGAGQLPRGDRHGLRHRPRQSPCRCRIAPARRSRFGRWHPTPAAYRRLSV